MQNTPVKIVVFGTINKDLILPFEGASIQSFGGIYYSITALSNLGQDQVEIIPVSFVGEDSFSNLLALIKSYNNINRKGLIEINQKNHEVILEYSSPEVRKEKALFKFPALEWKNIKGLLEADFYVVNMITGWDLSLKAFLKLSKKYYQKMYIDIHFLVMGTDKLGNRFPEAPEYIGHWLRGAKFVQMNEKEFNIINFAGLHESEFFEQYFNPDQILIITLANKGAQIIFRKDNMIRNKHFPPYKLEQFFDGTGCGDVFGASFVLKYLSSKNIYTAVDYANQAAAANCMLRGTNEMDLLYDRMTRLRLGNKE
jgi:sugar/nucleoside kinase (ribokinase family)